MKKLRSYQKAALRYANSQAHPALFMEMRLGKTLVTIRSIKCGGFSRILIVGPYSVFGSWLDELESERESKNGLVVLDSSGPIRSQLLKESWDSGNKWFLLSKEGHLVVPEICKFPWDCVVLDESTFIKAPPGVSGRTKRFNVSKYYTEKFRDVSKRYILTGTPAPESPLNYYMQLRFLDESILKVDSYWKFRHTYFKRVGHKWVLSKKGSAMLTRKLAENCFFLKRSEVNLGGEKIYEVRKVKMCPQANRTYKTLEDEFILEVDSVEVDATIYKTTQYIWLRRLCGGMPDTDGFRFNHKVKEIYSLLTSELQDQQVVIWCKFVDEIKALSKFLIKKKYRIGIIHGDVPQIERRAIQKKFQKGELDLIVGQPECYKYGTNLSASDTVIYFSTPDGSETRQQSEDRVIDTTSQNASLIIDLVVEDSLEEDIIESLKLKESNEERIRRIAQGIQRRRGYGNPI